MKAKAIYKVEVGCETHEGEKDEYQGLAENAIEAIKKALDKHAECGEKDCEHYVTSLECFGEPDF